MKKFTQIPLLCALLMPLPVSASELHLEFVKRCLVPMVDATAFVTEGLVGPFEMPSADIGVKGAAVQRQSWQFSNQDWELGTMSAGSEFFTVGACGITIFDFKGSLDAVVVEVMSSIGQPAETCKFSLNHPGKVGYRAVVHETHRNLPILVNFSPLNDGSHILTAWEVLPEIAASPCNS